jgi:polyisoprenoid-binding protein YceI
MIWINPIMTFALNIPNWEIVNKESTITFSATQNNAPISGQFLHFSGTHIAFDPEQLKKSHAEITVDMNSVMTSYEEILKNLKMTEWFNVDLFPKAIFKSTQFIKVEKNIYQVSGMLTIKNKTSPMTIQFTLDEYTPDKIRIKGYFILKRTQFNIGEGDWANVDNIKDDVKVDFTILAIREK